MIKISVAIVTKNRVVELAHCLGSILANSEAPSEIIVIDNNSSDQTRQLVAGLAENSKISIKYENYSSHGYPKIYNQALKLAKSNWVAVIDDDCVADTDWLKEIKKSIALDPTLAAIMGWCGTYYTDNVYSQVTLLFDSDWKSRSLSGEVVTDCEVLDNKNIVYNKKFLMKNSLGYDEARIKYESGAAEDCDLGLQIQTAGGEAICNKKMLVWHKDPQNWLWLMKKNISSWRAYQSLLLKWPITEREKLKQPPQPLLVLVDEFGDEHGLSFWQKIRLWLVAKQILLLNRLLPIIDRINYL